MKRLGLFTKPDGDQYDCIYFPGEKVAQAIGPIPKPAGAAGTAVELSADSEEEAIEKLIEALGPGTFK